MKHPSLGPLAGFLIFVSTLCSPLTSHGQEVIVSFDSHDDQRGTIFRIDRELRDELRLFLEHPTFERAQLFRSTDGLYRLEVTYQVNGIGQRSSKTLDSLQVASIREEITSKLLVERSLAEINQSGRTHFLWTTALASIFYYGPAATVALDAGDADDAATTYLLSAGAGFFLPYLLTQGSTMTNGMAAGARVGAVLGIIHAGQLFGSFGFLNRAQDEEVRTFMGLSALLSLAEMGAGIAAAKEFNIPDGRMNMIGAGGLLGGFGGELWGNVILGEEVSDSEIGLFSIAGSAAGMYIANQLALSDHYTTGDAKAFLMGGVAGTALAASILGAADLNPNDRIFSSIVVGAGIVSSLATHRWLSARDLRDAQGNYIVIGTVGWLALGTAITAASNSRNEESVLLATGIGAAVGFLTLAGTMHSSTRDRSSLEVEPGSTFGALEFNLNPAGLALAMTRSELDFSGSRPDQRANVPIASVQFKL